MRFNFTLKALNSTLVCLFLFSAIIDGQSYSFTNYGAESDIPNGFIYTINQADNGFIWVGTGNGLSRFDGFSFHNVQYPDSIGRLPTASLKDRNGTLWFGCSDGSVFYSKENNLVSVPLSNTRKISEILEGPDGEIYIIPQGKAVFGINPTVPEEIQQYSLSVDPVMFSAAFSASGHLLIGTQENILICSIKENLVTVVDIIEGFDYAGVTSIHQMIDRTRFVVGTDGNGLFQLQITDNGNVLSRFPDHPEWESLFVQSISEDFENNLWVSTHGSGVIQFQLSENYEAAETVGLYSISSGLASDDVETIFQDIEGNYWIGLYGEGLSMLASNAFGYYTPGSNTIENNIIYINSINDKYLLGTPEGFHIFDPLIGKSLSFTNLSNQVCMAEITSYYLDNEKNLWIGTGGNGLYVGSIPGSVRLFHRTGDSGADDIRDIEMDDKNIWLATINGVIAIERESGNSQIFSISNGLPHNYINKIFLSPEGYAYIGTESDRLFKIDRDYNISSEEGIMDGGTINRILSFSRDRNGGIWTATNGNGIFGFINDSVYAINRSNDLMSNYSYSILADSENNIWIGHDKGFSRYDPEKGIMKVFGTNYAKDGICNPDGIYESIDGKIFIGTTDGLIIYDRSKDKKNIVAPISNINYIIINDVRYPYQPTFSLPYKKNYTIRINYVGINLSNPEKVFYSTYMENSNSDWSQMTTEREKPYGLSDGKYKFYLMSFNEEGLSQAIPVSFEIFIKSPFWRRWWFVLSAIAAITGIVILIIRQRDKAQKKIQDYLEKELAARTSVVMKQKGEIELQNIEITDSINYAKRIQSSILPDISKLKETFKDAFIFFHPRDIVSGDFYWFEKLEEDKFILVCADSTGHGVPGAFMSMIGSTLLQDIVSRKRISQPSEILKLLDKQIFETLNQNVELGVSNDGMDMVVCEFNAKTRHIRFASAMRPVIIVIEGEPYYIKGNRLSVGGESVIEKYFDDQEYYLKEGDTVYLFSDGLPDQFGGVDGKKFKIARLKRLIEQVSKLPMIEQKEAVSKYFFNWKGDHDQVDDILLMGIKV